jgi:hypothetical protein
MFCTNCGHNLDNKPNYCPKCGSEVKSIENQPKRQKKKSSADDKMISKQKKEAVYYHHGYNIRPKWKLVLLFYFTLNLYNIYWLYKNWANFKREFDLNISPGLRTFGLLVPFLNLYLWYDNFKLIKTKAKQMDIEANYNPALLVFIIILTSLFSSFVPTIGWLVFFLFPFFYFPAQNTLNRMWTNKYSDIKINKGFDKELVVALLFFILLALTVFILV